VERSAALHWTLGIRRFRAKRQRRASQVASSVNAIALARLRQILAARSIIEAAIRPLKYLTEQAESRAGNANEAKRLATLLLETGLGGGLAAISSGLMAKYDDRDLVWRRTDAVGIKSHPLLSVGSGAG